jgi:hypothetical protein
MPGKLENSSGWYVEATLRKVKCLLCKAFFARKASRMLSHLGYEGSYGVHDKGVLLCWRTTPKIRRFFHKCGGTFLLYPERIGVALFDSSSTPRVGGLHALRQGTPESLHAQVVDWYKLKFKGHKRMHGKPIETLRMQWNMLLQWSEQGNK